MRCHRLWKDARLATMAGHDSERIESGMIAEIDGRIIYAGSQADAPSFTADETFDCGGRWITPGLIDCHTHIVHAGNRAHEFELRLAGASYADIARAGGGIMSTVEATRKATPGALAQSALGRIDRLIAEGVTTVEVKSGYGLSLADEIKMLRVATTLGEARPITISRTLLAAHAVPTEFAGKADDYIDLICQQIIPQVAVAGLADAVDGFCEAIGFSPAQIERVFASAKAHGLPVKLHAEQLSNLGGAALASRYGALSADHLEFLDVRGVAAMRQSGSVAVMLPGAYYFLRETQLPPVEQLRAAGVPMAIATDCNPGTSPMTSLLLAMNMAATLFGLTIEECLAGVTRNAAAALGMAHETGTLETGKRCDLAIWDVGSPAEIVYHMGYNPLHARIWGGQ